MDDYVAKPIDQRELVSKVAALLARSMGASALQRQAG
jgi:DNA-binding response OmpR family regulator